MRRDAVLIIVMIDEERGKAMKRDLMCLSAAAFLGIGLVACGDSGSTGNGSGGQAGSGGGAGGSSGSAGRGGSSGSLGSGGSSGSAGSGGSSGSLGSGGSSGTAGTGGSSGGLACDQVKAKAEAYKAAHPGNGGKDWDINAKTAAQIASDPAAQELRALCGKDERPIIPLLAWEYGGADHPWINPQASAAVYCVYIPVNPSTEHWSYDAATDRVTADVYVKCPDQNPCNNRQGPDQVMGCLGDASNIEIIVDTASLNDGMDVGLDVSTASTQLKLIQANGTKIDLYLGL